MIFVTIFIISTLTFAGQSGPWDNDLEASLFIDSPTDGSWGGVFIASSDNAVDWTVTWTNYGEIADPAGIQTSDGILIFVTALYSTEP
ncbi:MAG: hypothetical protein H8E86_02660 [Planctomycetes bacterium]|nr:hypothetical protein [Planctomycetota bacterium]